MRYLKQVIFTALFCAVGSQAATFTVTNANDTGVGSLRWAITEANSNGVTDTIMFNIPGAGPHVIDVVSTLPQITTPMSILGDTQPGYAGTPLIEIHGPSTNIAILDTGINCTSPNITVRALRLTGFRYAGFAGGDVSGNVFLQGCVLDGNSEGAVIGNNITVGGTVSSNRNIIINNATNGILVWWPGAKIYGNFIGVQADGVTPAGNGENGIRVQYTKNVEIKGGPGYPQVISGNKQNGIMLAPNGSYVYFCSNITVQGNFIGTDVTGMNAVSNKTGIYIWGGTRNLIGGTSTNLRNVIAGNTDDGINISAIGETSANAFSNLVYGNFIGLAADGETVLSNDIGVIVYGGFNNQIGGLLAGQGNRFGAAGFYHVQFRRGYVDASGNTAAGNWFGLSVSTQVLGRAYAGVEITDGSSNLVGGVTAGARNYFGGVDTGVSISGSNAVNNRIVGNWFGLKPNGSVAPINSYGVEIYNAPMNQVGGTSANEANVISGCQFYGVRISGAGSYFNIVEGNNIGTDPTVTLSVSNRYAGVDIAGGAYSNRVGATNSNFDAMNVIAGNASSGISIRDSNTYGNVVSYNLIGMNRSFVTISNVYRGIDIFQSPMNQIGPANTIGHSGSSGINIAGETAVSNRIFGNFIGMDVLGTQHPNSYGIGVAAPANKIGGPTSAERNYIGGNNVNGIDISAGGDGTVIQGNYIGLNTTGTGPVSNRQYGIIVNNAANVIIGGLGDARNVLAASRLTGIVIAGSSSNTIVAGNYIGTTADGMSRIGVGTAGIAIDADDVMIGFPFAGLGNIIGGANAGAIEVSSGGRNVRIRNNSVGIGVDGVTNIPNARGIVLRSTAKNVHVGGTNALDANVVARNNGTEFWIQGGSAGNRVEGNYIGVMNGGVAFPTIQSGIGLDIENSPSNWIVKNVIGQHGDAVRLTGTGSYHNVVLGNYIGEYNLEDIGSSGWGVYILNGSGNIIGGDSVDARNVIAHNDAGGVLVTNNGGFSAVNNRIGPSLIFSNRVNQNIDLGSRGPTTNDAGDADIGANNLQNKPFVTNGITVSGNMIVYAQGVLNSSPNTTYAIDIYRSGNTNAEGRGYLGRTYVETDGAGDAQFTAGFPINLATGVYLSATATDPDGNTSEFSVSPAGLVFKAVADGDNDGIPDFWEQLYGLNPGVSNSPASDVDVDGYSDYEEYIADTAANDGTKYPIIVAFANESEREVTFPSSSLRVYNLQYNDDIGNDPVWMQMGGVVTGFYGQTTMVDTNLPEWRNYRIGVRLP